MVVKKGADVSLVSRTELLDRIRDVLLATHARTSETRQTLIASVSFCIAVAPDDVLRWWWAERGLSAWLWREPHTSDVVVAVGQADRVEASGARRFVEMERAYRTACERVIRYDGAPIQWFCGFAFIPDAAQATQAAADDQRRKNPWRNWPNAALVLPEYVVRLGQRESQLIVNVPVSNNGFNVETVVQRIEDNLHGLLSTPQMENGSNPARDTTASCGGEPADDTLVQGERETWESRVSDAAGQVRSGRLSKVVLARQHALKAGWGTTPIETLLSRLLEQFPESYRFAVWQVDSLFVGASPERLVRVQGQRVELDCLAGTAARGNNDQLDERNQQWLLSSDKNLREHRVLVEWMRMTVEPLLMDVNIPPSPGIRKQSAVQHLHTPVTGWFRDGISIFDLLAAVHPTPAVAGVPRDGALLYISACEDLDRGWYSGGVGWIDGNGDGELCVALRSALVRQSDSLLFAGGGVMGDSDPEEEWHETEYKLQPMKSVLWPGDSGATRRP